MQVCILGPVEVRDEDRAIAIGGTRIRSLLTRLAVAEGGVVSATDLADAVWDGDAPADETNALQSLVSRLRRVLGAAATVQQVGSGYRLQVEPDDVDAHRFRRLADAGRRLLQAGDAHAAERTLTEALHLWHGPALADLHGVAGSGTVAALTEAHTAAREDRLEARLRTGRAAEVVTDIEELVSAHPLRERPLALLLDALVEDGRAPEALQAYERFRQTLAEQLGTDPSPALQSRHLALLGADTGHGAAARTNLRAQLTSFLGRDVEIARIAELLAGARLVTLIGPGGAGKTRLAVEAAAGLLAGGPGWIDGAWLVELAPVTDPVDLAQAVVGSLGVRGIASFEATLHTQRRDAFERLVDGLRDKQALLIMDNCEHLIDAAAALCDRLLAMLPGLQILATSREPLAITGEVLCAVPPLPHQVEAGVDPESVAAVRLFADRARAVDPTFRLTEANTAAVSEICRRLDGLPLAIELAAARTRAMTIEQIAARLDDRFRLLTGGSRTALPRHRTLRAVVDWSWDLLSEAERDLAERLAVFPAGVTPASAAAAIGGGDVEDLLAALVDRSLLQLIGGDGPRYRMLETIREYGTDRLAERGALGGARQRHAAYFLELAATAARELRGPDQMRWIALTTAERDNLYAALSSLCEEGQADRAVQLASSLTWFMTMRGEHDIALAWLRLALAVPGGRDDEQRAIAMGAMAMNHMLLEDVAGGERMLLDAETRLRPYIVADANPDVIVLGLIIALFTGDEAAARERIAYGMHVDDIWVHATVQMMRAVFADNVGDIATMRDATAQALALTEQIGDRFLRSGVYDLRSRLTMFDGDLPTAIEQLQLSARLGHEFGNHDDATRSQVMAAGLLIRLGRFDEARQRLEEARAQFEAMGSGVALASVHNGLAELARATGDHAAARRHSDEALRRVTDVATAMPPQVLAVTQAVWAAARMSGDVDAAELAAAEQALRMAMPAAARSNDMPVAAEVVLAVALLWSTSGRHQDAVAAVGASDALRGISDHTHLDRLRIIAAATDALGTAAVDAELRRGAALDRGAALGWIGDRLEVDLPTPLWASGGASPAD